MRCNVCGVDVPDFVWPTRQPGGHYVLVDSPVMIRQEPRPGGVEANLWTIVAEATIRFELCRDLHPELARLRDAQAGDPGWSVPGTPDVIRKAARWIDQGGALDGQPWSADRLDAAHAAVMADADLLLGDPEAVRAKNRAALLDEERRAGEILRGNRPAPDTSWVTTRDVRDAYPRSGWLRGILPWTRGRRRAGS